MATKVKKTGTLDEFSFPGGYPIIYWGKDDTGEEYILCGACANDPAWRSEIHLKESAAEYEHIIECSNCYKSLVECYKHSDGEECESCGPAPTKEEVEGIAALGEADIKAIMGVE